MRFHRGDVAGEIARRLTAVHDVQIIERIDLGDDVLHRYDPDRRVLGDLPAPVRRAADLQVRRRTCLPRMRRPLEKLVDEGNFTSESSRKLAMLGLANYFAAAPCCPIRHSTTSRRTSATTSSDSPAFFSQSYETICHRLSTLQRPKLRGVPFSFVRVDRAGNMSKRQSATGFHFSSSGGTCPLWNVYETFAYPGKIMTQIAADARRP